MTTSVIGVFEGGGIKGIALAGAAAAAMDTRYEFEDLVKTPRRARHCYVCNNIDRVVAIAVDRDPLDFDLTRHEARGLFDHGYETARRYLNHHPGCKEPECSRVPS